jgi:hypothetical protein
MLALEELRTPQLLLSRPPPEDLEDFARMYADPVVVATLSGVRSRDDRRACFDRERWQHLRKAPAGERS